MIQYDSLISKQHPSHWKVVRNKAFLSATGEIVGKRANEYTLLSLTTNGVIVRDVESGKGKFPKDFDNYQVVKPNELVFCLFDIDETPRTVGLVKKEGMLTGAYTALKVNKSLASPQFVYYYYLAVDNTKGLRPYYSGLRKTVRADKFLQIYIPLPPLIEQEKIVDYLEGKISKIDALLIEKKKEVDLYKEYIETLIYTNNTGESIIINDWNNCFPDSYAMISCRGLFEEITLKGFSNERFLAVTQDKGLIYKDVDGVNFVTAEKKETQKLICSGQFVISLRSFEGGIEYSDKRGLISPAYIVLKLKDQYDTHEMRMFYRFLFKSAPFINRLNTISDSMRDGKSIKFSDIQNYKFPIPSKEVLSTVLRYVKAYDAKYEAFTKEAILLNEYKQRLIADCVTGQVKI